jgi:hypothetical protein
MDILSSVPAAPAFNDHSLVLRPIPRRYLQKARMIDETVRRICLDGRAERSVCVGFTAIERGVHETDDRVFRD